MFYKADDSQRIRYDIEQEDPQNESQVEIMKQGNTVIEEDDVVNIWGSVWCRNKPRPYVNMALVNMTQYDYIWFWMHSDWSWHKILVKTPVLLAPTKKH